MKIGDTVAWTSQAGGSYKYKRGNIVCIVQSFQNPVMIASDNFPDHKRMFDGLRVPIKGFKAYLVEVKDGITGNAKPKLYMPKPNQLKVIE